MAQSNLKKAEKKVTEEKKVKQVTEKLKLSPVQKNKIVVLLSQLEALENQKKQLQAQQNDLFELFLDADKVDEETIKSIKEVKLEQGKDLENGDLFLVYTYEE